MKTTTTERKGYKRLNFNLLNFAESKNSIEDNMENITPIDWSKEVLVNGRKIIIKKP